MNVGFAYVVMVAERAKQPRIASAVTRGLVLNNRMGLQKLHRQGLPLLLSPGLCEGVGRGAVLVCCSRQLACGAQRVGSHQNSGSCRKGIKAKISG